MKLARQAVYSTRYAKNQIVFKTQILANAGQNAISHCVTFWPDVEQHLKDISMFFKRMPSINDVI